MRVLKLSIWITLGLSFLNVGQANGDDAQSPKMAVESLFKAMFNGDEAGIHDLFLPEASLDRVKADGTIQRSTYVGWASWVGKQSAGDADERIFGLRMQQQGGLATVWAPFDLTYKGEHVGCGVNQFTLVNTNEGWKVVHGIDTPYAGDCAEFVQNNK